MADFMKIKPSTIAAWLLVGIVSAAAFLSVAPRKGEANGGGPAGDTIPAQLRFHYEDTATHSRVSNFGGDETSTHWTLDTEAVLEVPHIDYHARDFQGREVQYVFFYDKSGGLKGPRENQSDYKVISFSGQASYSWESHSAHSHLPSGKSKQDANLQGSGPMGPGNGSFLIQIKGDKIAVSAHSGSFPATGEKSWSGSSPDGKSSQGGYPLQQKQNVGSPRFPLDGTNDPYWTGTIHTRWTGSGWAGTVEKHTHETSGILDEKQEDEHLIKITFTFDLRSDKLELKYAETSLDVARLMYEGEPIDRHVFVMNGNSWLPHSNMAGEVWIAKENKVRIATVPTPDHRPVTSQYGILRFARSWPLDASGKPVPNMISHVVWHLDSKDPTQDWIDNAGVSFLGPPDTWKLRAVLDEFLVRVRDRSECECIYAAFVMEVRKQAYRIKYSTPEKIDQKEYLKRIRSHERFFDYPFADDKGWTELTKVGGKWKVVDNPNP